MNDLDRMTQEERVRELGEEGGRDWATVASLSQDNFDEDGFPIDRQLPIVDNQQEQDNTAIPVNGHNNA